MAEYSIKMKLDRFGKYLLLDHFVDGGMASLYRAKEIGSKKDRFAEKIIAIKVIKSAHSKNNDFKEMFLDEIKTAYALSHPNICQIYNYGEKDNILFAVLEYIDGRNLKDFNDLLIEKNKKFPPDIIAYIISSICQGLHYAHKFIDPLTGIEQNIIHRDISPHNIMLDFKGIIKIIDFGIAKAESNSDFTTEGSIKGKVSYIAPEYLEENIQLDGRYDQFALGLVMWELYFGKRLFNESSDIKTLQKIYECDIPEPQSIDPNINPFLSEILVKSLSKSPHHRYKDMEEMNKAVTRFLYSTYPDFSPGDIIKFMNNEFPELIAHEQKTLKEFGTIETAPYMNDLEEELEGDTPESSHYMEVSDESVITPENRIKLLEKRQRFKDKDDARRMAAQKIIFGQSTITDEDAVEISSFILDQRGKGIHSRVDIKIPENLNSDDNLNHTNSFPKISKSQIKISTSKMNDDKTGTEKSEKFKLVDNKIEIINNNEINSETKGQNRDKKALFITIGLSILILAAATYYIYST